MKLYKLPTAPAGERWHSAKTGLKDFVEIDLPKDGRAGMASLFNTNEREVALEAFGAGAKLDDDVRALDPLEAAEMRAVAAAQAPTATPVPQQLTADAIVAFILDYATTAQTETIFAALGTRFKEQTHAAG